MSFEKKSVEEMIEQLNSDLICFVKIDGKVYLIDIIEEDKIYVSDSIIDKKPFEITLVESICSLKNHLNSNELMKIILENYDENKNF
jgi:hypothetical protein